MVGIDLKREEKKRNEKILEIVGYVRFQLFFLLLVESSSNIITKLSANKKAIQFVVQYIKC